MATVNIYNLNPTGAELFTDSETYLKELSTSDSKIQGGYVPPETDLSVIYSLGTLPYSPLCVIPAY